jgi:putative transposase
MKAHYTAQEIASSSGKNKSTINRRAKKEAWKYQKVTIKGGIQYQYLYESLPDDIQVAIQTQAMQEYAEQESQIAERRQVLDDLPEKKRKVALAKADLVRLYAEALARAPKKGKVQARAEFARAYNAGAWQQLYEILGERSWQTIERWKTEVKRNGDPYLLSDKRGQWKKGVSSLSDKQTEVILKCVMRPNQPNLSESIRMAQAACRHLEIESLPSEATIRRYLKKVYAEHYDLWMFCREGQKAWNDNVAKDIQRDPTLISVGDMLCADGHMLNFEIINPWTGKPKRMPLVLWVDMRSNYPLGWEIMPSENIQSIATALRRAILCLGKFPRVAYLDNGRAFKAKVFTEKVDFSQCGLSGIFERMGTQPVFTWPYHGQSKPIERFFRTFGELERWTPTYTGTSIDKKPPRLNRGEKVHRDIHRKNGTPVLYLDEAHQLIASYFDEFTSRPSRAKHLGGRSPREVFLEGVGPGVDPEELRHLMMEQEERTITQRGVPFLGQDYYHPALYGRKHKVTVKYDLQDRSSILVYDTNGQFLCEAEPMRKVHPAAEILGNDEDREELKNQIKIRKKQEQLTGARARKILENEVLPEHQQQLVRMGLDIGRDHSAPSAPVTQPVQVSEPEYKEPTKEQVVSFEKAKKRIIEKRQREETEGYVVPEEIFMTLRDRYDWLFKLTYKKGVELRPDDKAFMEDHEKSERYIFADKARYDKLKELYLKQRDKQKEDS